MKMPSRKNRTSKRVLLPAGVLAGVLVIGGGGAVASGALDDSDNLTGGDLDRASSAALKEVGDGKVVSAEVSDDKGVAYELEIHKSNGSEIDVDLDKSYAVVHTDTDRDDDEDGDGGDEDREDAREDAREDGRDADDRRLSDAEWTSIEKAATDEAGGGTLTDAEASDDRGVAYEAEVRRGSSEVDVSLDSDFGVVDSHKDDAN